MKLPPTFSKEKKTIYSVIESPKGSHNKFTYDEGNDFFQLTKTLPAGTSFPLDFGFIPGTKGEDKDPLDVLVIMDFPTYPGCVVECRVLGIIEAEQKEQTGKPIRNDRIIAVAADSLCYSELKDIADVNKNLLDQVIHFFEYYNSMANKRFKLLKIRNKSTALKLIKKQTI